MHNPYHLVDTKKGRQDLLKLLKKQKAFSFDTETTSIQANEAILVGLSFCVTPHEAYYIPTANKEEAEAIVAEFKEVLENEKITKIGQNINCLLYTSPSPRDRQKSRMPSSA